MALRSFLTHYHIMKNTNSFPFEKPADTQSFSGPNNSPSSRIDVRPSRDEVATKAYYIYLNRGCPQGQDQVHWFEAEAQAFAARNPGLQRNSALF